MTEIASIAQQYEDTHTVVRGHTHSSMRTHTQQHAEQWPIISPTYADVC